jgi:hypothetical protein
MTVYVAFNDHHVCPKSDEIEFRYIRFAKRKDAKRILRGLPKGQRGWIVEEKDHTDRVQRFFYDYGERPFFAKLNHPRSSAAQE